MLPSKKRLPFKRFYALICGILFILGICLTLLKGDLNFVVSDGRGYYVYLPSLVVDGDLNFANQIQNHWDVDFNPDLLAKQTSQGLIPNKYPIGFALSLLPAFVLAHGVSSVLDFANIEGFSADGYSAPYQLFCFATVLCFGFFTLVWTTQLLQKPFGFAEPTAVFAVLIVWLCTNSLYYYVREPMMVHVVSSFWVLSVVRGLLGAQQTPKTTALSGWILGFCAGMAIVCRPTNGLIIGPFFVFYSVLNIRLWSFFMLLAGTLIPLGIQAVVWKTLYGSFLYFSYESEGFNWSHPMLWQTLFSSKHGLIFWSPILGFSLFGLVLGGFSHWKAEGLNSAYLASRKRFATASCVAFAGLWYANSCWHQWWFGDAFGARAFLELGFVFVFGLCVFLEGFDLLQRHRAWVLFATFACGLYNLTLMALYILRKIPRADFLF